MSGLIQVSDMANRSVSLSEINLEMARYLFDIDLILAWETFKNFEGPGFGLMTPASRSKIRSQRTGYASGMDMVDLIRKCKQSVVDGGLKGEKMTSG